MMRPGLVSVTFRRLAVEDIIRLVKEAGLAGIEWGGDVHVPHGDMEKAREVGRMTRQAGLTIAAYGSYYRVAESEGKGLLFQSVLDTAGTMKAPVIRVWAGSLNSEQADTRYWQAVVDDSRRIAEAAARENIKIVYEFHSHSLTNTYESCRKLLQDVDHANLGTYWQPILGWDKDKNGEKLDLILPWIQGVHVFHWWPTTERHSLETGKDDWTHYFHILKQLNRPFYGLLEFVKDEAVENFTSDAQTLKTLINQSSTLSQ